MDVGCGGCPRESGRQATFASRVYYEEYSGGFSDSFQGIRIFHVHAQGTEYIQIFRLHMTDHSLLFLVSGVNQQVKALRFTLAHGAFRNLAVMACINFFDCDGPWSVTL